MRQIKPADTNELNLGQISPEGTQQKAGGFLPFFFFRLCSSMQEKASVRGDVWAEKEEAKAAASPEQQRNQRNMDKPR